MIITTIKTIISKKISVYKKDKEWGGDFTSTINPSEKLFFTPEKIIEEVKQHQAVIVFNKLTPPFCSLISNQTDQIKLIITNKDNKTVKISNKNSLLYSLPWTIEYQGVTMQSYNPSITMFINSIFPENFENHEMVTAGELIYKLIEQEIIDSIQYKP